MAETLPLFPLSTVVFPDGPLRLRIFEARYVDLVGRCLRENSGFGVALIVEGSEVGPARTANVGTEVRIADFERLSDGLLGITARGERRFKIASVRRETDGLNVAQVEWYPRDPSLPVPDEYASLVLALRQTLPQLGGLYGGIDERYEDAAWVAGRFAEVMPLHREDRQRCLEMDDPIDRLRFLRAKVLG